MPNRADRRRAKSKKRGGSQKAHAHMLSKLNAERYERELFQMLKKKREETNEKRIKVGRFTWWYRY